MVLSVCLWVRARLPLLAGGELIGPDRRWVERHLVRCSSCRRRLESLQGALEALRAAGCEDPLRPGSPSLWPSLARQIRESRRPGPSPWPRLVAWATTGLAASLLVVGVLVADPFGRRPADLPTADLPASLPARIARSANPTPRPRPAPFRFEDDPAVVEDLDPLESEQLTRDTSSAPIDSRSDPAAESQLTH